MIMLFVLCDTDTSVDENPGSMYHGFLRTINDDVYIVNNLFVAVHVVFYLTL